MDDRDIPLFRNTSRDDDLYLMTDELLLEKMKAAAIRRFHYIFETYEAVLWHRYVEFTIDDGPIDLSLAVIQIPEGVRERYLAIRGLMHPPMV